MVRACQRWDLQMRCSQNWPYSAFRFAPLRDNSWMVGKQEVIVRIGSGITSALPVTRERNPRAHFFSLSFNNHDQVEQLKRRRAIFC
jgi:hypothetical protein